MYLSDGARTVPTRSPVQTLKIHAIQTGLVRIKTAQVEGRGHGLARGLAIFTDRNWTDWLHRFTRARRQTLRDERPGVEIHRLVGTGKMIFGRAQLKVCSLLTKVIHRRDGGLVRIQRLRRSRWQQFGDARFVCL